MPLFPSAIIALHGIIMLAVVASYPPTDSTTAPLAFTCVCLGFAMLFVGVYYSAQAIKQRDY